MRKHLRELGFKPGDIPTGHYFESVSAADSLELSSEFARENYYHELVAGRAFSRVMLAYVAILNRESDKLTALCTDAVSSTTEYLFGTWRGNLDGKHRWHEKMGEAEWMWLFEHAVHLSLLLPDGLKKAEALSRFPTNEKPVDLGFDSAAKDYLLELSSLLRGEARRTNPEGVCLRDRYYEQLIGIVDLIRKRHDPSSLFARAFEQYRKQRKPRQDVTSSISIGLSTLAIICDRQGIKIDLKYSERYLLCDLDKWANQGKE